MLMVIIQFLTFSHFLQKQYEFKIDFDYNLYREHSLLQGREFLKDISRIGRDIKKMISTQKEKYKWEFLFIGANIDAIKSANDIGVHKDFACNMIADDKGIDTVFDSVSSCIKMCMTPTLNISRNWKTKLEKDYNKRAKNKVK